MEVIAPKWARGAANFRGLINDAKSAVGNLVLKYFTRAAVAVSFLIAIGFAVAAIASMLVERFGAVTGYWIVAGGMTAIGIIAAHAVSVREQGGRCRGLEREG